MGNGVRASKPFREVQPPEHKNISTFTVTTGTRVPPQMYDYDDQLGVKQK